LKAMTNMPISFPGLFGDWQINPDPVAIDVGNGIYWYGIILAVAMLAGLFLAMKQAKHYGLEEDHVMDLVLWGIPCCIIGARLYYVLFYLDLYRDEATGALQWGRMIAIWDGGLAIYGAIIAGAIVAFIYARSKKIPVPALMDVAVIGLLLGQSIGRWANFINREAFGTVTNLPWRMEIWIEGLGPTGVHPTFLYESLWNLVGMLLIIFVVSKGRRFDGENTCFYFIWYGMGRAWIEGLRTDSLYFFDFAINGNPIRVSQVLSVIVALVALGIMLYMGRVKKADPAQLWLYRSAELKKAAEAAEETAVEAPSVEEVLVEETVAAEEVVEEPEEKTDGDQN